MTVPLSVFDSLPDPVIVVEGREIAWVNAAFAELLGRTREALVGQPVDALLIEAKVGVLAEAARGAHALSERLFHLGFRGERGVVWLDVRVGRAEGDRWILSGRDPSELAGVGSVISALGQLYVKGDPGTMVDLDDLVEAARPVFEGLGWDIGIYELHDEGVTVRSILLPTTVSERMLEAAQSTLGRMVPWSAMPTLRRIVDASALGGFLDDFDQVIVELTSALGMPLEAREKVGKVFEERHFHRALWAPALIGGRVAYCVFAVGPQLMERHLAAIQLFAAQVAATVQLGEFSRQLVRGQRQAALGQMAALLAHEVRNPLAVMFQAQRQVRKKAGADPVVAQLLDILDEEAGRLNRLMGDLVKFAGPMQIQLQPLAVESVVQAAVASVRETPGLDIEGVEIVEEIPPRLPEVRADPMLLQDAVRQLLANACAYVSRGGKVHVRAEAEDGGVFLRVVNDGPPLAREVAERVFEPFFTTKATGSGLGLAVVRKTIEQQGGRVALDSADTGVSFSVWLPAA